MQDLENMKIEIRQEQPSDYTDVFAVNCRAFGRNNEAKLVDALRISDAFIPGLSIVALIDGKIVGHILFTRLEVRDESGRVHYSLCLGPMAVDEASQNQGIGSQLANFGL